MKRAFVVIGAGYGDEGKGLMTDYLCHRYEPDAVIRFNGGAQAGHTVTTPDGKRHVFGHFGSGTFLGIPTILSRFFVVNPILFCKELDKLSWQMDTSNVAVLADVRCMVTTPYDILVNQLVEKKRSESRHGSCGVGFGETIGRNHFVELTMKDLGEMDLRRKLDIIRHKWFPKQCEKFDIDYAAVREIVENDYIVENYVQDVKRMLDKISMVSGSVVGSFKTAVFEGAQGLMLDQDYGVFPHVTRSNTGMKNVSALCLEHDVSNVTTTYVTRSYVTRHGAGPLRNECQRPYANIVDETNLPHDFQGTLRFAPLDINELKQAILHDIRESAIDFKADLAVTCLDQLDKVGRMVVDGKVRGVRCEEFADTVHDLVGIGGQRHQSFGPSRNFVRSFL